MKKRKEKASWRTRKSCGRVITFIVGGLCAECLLLPPPLPSLVSLPVCVCRVSSFLVALGRIANFLLPSRDAAIDCCSVPPRILRFLVLLLFFFLGGVTATAPSRDLTDNKKNEEGGLKQRRKQKEAAQGDPEPKKGNQEKEKYPSRVQS